MTTMPSGPDPYQALGVSRSATDAELRSAYRRLVQLHHPDHNRGSVESARRFEEVQEAYAEIRKLRQTPGSAGRGRESSSASSNPGVDSRLADIEQELKAAREARERAVREARKARDRVLRDTREAREQVLRDARKAAGARSGERPSDEELGYISTDDSFSKILADAAAELSERLSEVRETPVARRVSDLIDELGSKLTGEPPDQ
jgi:curved DNA-binding protein CbpA